MRRFQAFARLRSDLAEAKSKLAERDTIDLAKRILMAQRRLTEPEACAELRRTAMNQGCRIAEITEALITAHIAFDQHASGTQEMTISLTIGFLPLVDACLSILAREHGFAEEEGLLLTLVRDMSWATVLDRLLYGYTDAAHMVAPLAISTTL